MIKPLTPLDCKFIIPSLLLLFCLCQCAPGKDNAYVKVNYEQALQQIEHSLVDLTSPDEPIGYPPFMTLYHHAGWYVGDAIRIIQSGESTYIMKRLAIYNMQGLSEIDDYLTFFEAMIVEFEQGSMDEDLLGWGMGMQPHMLFIEHYKNDREQALLTRLANCPRSSERLRAYIKDVKSGKALETAMDWW